VILSTSGRSGETISAPRRRVAGLFAGIGGLEFGLIPSSADGGFFCEIDPKARAVLDLRFPNSKIESDVRLLNRLPEVDIVTAGFPCQDLSMAGHKRGIGARRSGLVSHLFRLLRDANRPPRWVLIENVPYMLHLDRGRAMGRITRALERLGYSWAYRVVDARAFGVPQRRQRVYLLASRSEDPRRVLFADESGACPVDDSLMPQDDVNAYGFYWTEGARGVGWAASSIPPIKGGSSLGIPSPPAVWRRSDGLIGTITIEDAERLQGFPARWTEPAVASGGRAGDRWRLVGNAVCASVVSWIGVRMHAAADPVVSARPLVTGARWPKAAWGVAGERREAVASPWPVETKLVPIERFLGRELVPLSEKATAGYLRRVLRCPCKVSGEFVEAVRRHLVRMQAGRVPRRARARLPR
jgi:DNA (cytosine-5)-methyltransferase 1